MITSVVVFVLELCYLCMTGLLVVFYRPCYIQVGLLCSSKKKDPTFIDPAIFRWACFVVKKTAFLDRAKFR